MNRCEILYILSIQPVMISSLFIALSSLLIIFATAVYKSVCHLIFARCTVLIFVEIK